jgi:hypothetical protein
LIAAHADRHITLRDGRIVHDETHSSGYVSGDSRYVPAAHSASGAVS